MTGTTQQGLTEAQLRALRGIESGERPKPRWDVATRLMRAKMIHAEARIYPNPTGWQYVLTDAGREALVRENEPR